MSKTKNSSTKKAEIKKKISKTLPSKDIKKVSKIFTPLKNNLKYIIIILILAVIFAVGYFYKGQFIVASINGEPVTRVELWQRLEEQYGSQVLNGVVSEELILQAARKEGVVVSQEEIENELASIQNSVSAQGMTMEDALGFWGLNLDTLKEQIRLQLTLEKLIEGQVAVSDQEVEDYVNSLIESGEEDTPELRNQARLSIEQSKQSEAIQNYLDDLRSNSTVNVYNDNYTLPEPQPAQ